MRSFAQRFCGAAEGLGYNDVALKDLFNSALEEPLSRWRMRGLDHLTFGDFVEALACSPARVAGVPRAVLAEAAAPPVMADKAATQGGLETSSVAPSGPRPFPGRLGLVHSVRDPPLMSVRAARSAHGLPRGAVHAHRASEATAVPAHNPPEVAVSAHRASEAAVHAHRASEAAVARSRSSRGGGGFRSRSSRGSGAGSQSFRSGGACSQGF